MKQVFVLCLFLGVLTLSPEGGAKPIRGFSRGQHIQTAVKKTRSNGSILGGKKLQVKISGKAGIRWKPVPGTKLSIPYLTVRLLNVPRRKTLNVLVAKVGRLKPHRKKGYFVQMPMLQRTNRFQLTLIDERGTFEDWELDVFIELEKTAIIVDESCMDYHLKIKELRRPGDPNLIYMGCRAGTRPHHLSLDILWVDVDRIVYRKRQIRFESSILTVPLEHRRRTASKLIGIDHEKRKSVYLVEYIPVVPPSLEVWAGLAFFRTAFEQSNFDSKFSQIATAFTGRFWYRPEDTRLSIMARGFGNVFSISESLDPPTGNNDSVQTYFLSTELLYKVFDHNGWRIDPFFGGWLFFMRVKDDEGKSNFGLQRVITPHFGVTVEKALSKRNRVTFTTRVVPLQSFFNPFALSGDQLYLEFEGQFVHELKRGGRWFVSSYFGMLDFQDSASGGARTQGNYLVLGGGYGW